LRGLKNISTAWKRIKEIDLKFLRLAGPHETTRKEVKHLLSNYKKEHTLLLILDEAQRIARYRGNEKLEDLLMDIHNGKLDRPVVLLAGGLVTSSHAMGNFGISRFKAGHRINLGRLSQSATENIIRDWLVQKGKAQTGAELDHWIDHIACESNHWAQHIMGFVQPAVKILEQYGSELTDEKLTEVSRWGQKIKTEYYNSRFDGLQPEVFVNIQTLIQSRPEQFSLDGTVIKQALTSASTPEEKNRLFLTVLDKGIFANTAPNQYEIPIPSMRNWLLSDSTF